VQPSFARGRKLCALIPKSGRKSSNDDSSAESENEIWKLPTRLEDIKDFVAINLLMGIIDMPAYTDYWSREFRYSQIADIMPLKKFQQLRRYIHFNNNLLDDGDRYYKIRPLADMLRANFLKVPHEKKISIDEMMVPYKGKKLVIENNIAGVTGFVYDFLIYGGEDTFRSIDLSPVESSLGMGAKVVIALCKTIPDPACFVVYFDNFFTNLELIHYLREEMGIFSLGTIRANRLRGAEKKLMSDKALKKNPRGSHSQVVCNNKKVCVVKWYDNKCVTTASSYVDVHPISTIQRYDKEKKMRSALPCPEIIKQYNAHMGVDLADMLIALYRTELKGHRWYLPLVSQLLDMCITNSWILYRRNVGSVKTMSLKNFRYNIAKNLLLSHRTTTRHTDNVKGPTPSKLIKAPVAPRPTTEISSDQLGHFPTFGTKGRCKLCIKGQTTLSCTKCAVSAPREIHSPETDNPYEHGNVSHGIRKVRVTKNEPCVTGGLNGTCVGVFRCPTASLTYLYANAGYIKSPDTIYDYPDLPEICSYKNKEPVVCCTDCNISKDEPFRHTSIGPLGIPRDNNGPIAWSKCLDYLKDLPYPCRGVGNFQVKKIWKGDKKCHVYQLQYALAVGGRDAQRWEFPH
ncbi:hypothetical protein HW555_013841, partial [Spodoptera exigua]